MILHEAKYLYKNIQRKQKIIDNNQLHKYKKTHKMSNISREDNILFNTEIYNSILNQTVSVCQSHKENSVLILVKKNKQGVKNSKDSLEKLIDRIGLAEEGKINKRDYALMTGLSTELSSMERKTTDVSGVKSISNKFINKFVKSLKGMPKFVSNQNGLKSIKDKLADGMRLKYDTNAIGKRQFIEVKHMKVEQISNHKATQSMPKLTNILSSFHQNPVNNTLYQSIKSGKSNFSPSMIKDSNLTNPLTMGNYMRKPNEKKKSYKKLLRPELLNEINNDPRKNPYEIAITKINKAKNTGNSKVSMDYNYTTRNVIYL
jgi:hypothetical protein